jgi:hypothetical protein
MELTPLSPPEKNYRYFWVPPLYLDSKFNLNARIDHTVAKTITLINMLTRTARLSSQDNLQRSGSPNSNGGGEEETTGHLIFRCNTLHNQRNEMIKQIKTTCGNWPMTKETLTNDYLQIFVKFVKSIDFTELQ